ncbi:MFS transporter [Streptomyces antarcticus]|uniref:MFS transporter n=1 Tax=Streptomyces antarcticus TaxID=2996458 RepID=UPI00226E4780|nr:MULTISPECIES: MFS transporter [unclassified Streptomyces]MCY0946623.1 MFS transporter [Streptomyces sp. H34-AA3]MCZ4085685.1 MFS transporter [Streptomyces sp. H34-S5]
MLRNDRVARTMLGAITLSSVGVGIHTLAMGQLLYGRTGSPSAFAFVLTLQGVAALCVLPVCGPLVDALNSKWVYALCGLGRTGTVLLIVGVAALMPGTGAVPWIVAASALLAVFDNVERSALFKLTAHHVDQDHATRFNSLIGVAFQAGALTGMALLGLILTWGTAEQALMIDILMSLCCALAVSRIRLTANEGNPPLSARVLTKAVAGTVGEWRRMLVRYRGDRTVFLMILLCAGDFVFALGLSTLVIPLTAEFYGGQGWYVAALEATFAFGMISASFLTRHLVSQRLLPVWLCCQAGAAALLALGATSTVHFLAFFLAGFANLNSLTWLLTSLQQCAAEGDKAKMASLRLLAIGLGTAALMPVVGHFATASLGAGFWSLAATMALFALGAVRVARRHRPRNTEAGAARTGVRPAAPVAAG